MCKVYEFPMKPELTEELQNMLGNVARNYIRDVNAILEYIKSMYDKSDNYDEIMVMVYDYITNAMIQAVDEIQ